ncbi:MAG TPA: AraC family transcriptional regulator [Bryobacteraceae bacterium]|jgi:AraC-like DNA-binding protein|nr:AraC family transcriptional regulator [Bryobacteraceae bacterium]
MLMRRILAEGDGWSVSDIVCSSGPRDRPFEERHSDYSIALVRAGTFQYRSARGKELMTPGSLLLGSAGQCFECGHEHSTGDHCLSFAYRPQHFERLAHDAGGSGHAAFPVLRIPPVRPLSALLARCQAACDACAWEVLSLDLAALVVPIARGTPPGPCYEPSAAARVTRAIRLLDESIGAPCTLADLAREARLSPFHFLRTFRELTGITPHQYQRRIRLRHAAGLLAASKEKIIGIALACGFEDLSVFNRAFRSEFASTPSEFRRQNAR